jgi:protein phosphatase
MPDPDARPNPDESPERSPRTNRPRTEMTVVWGARSDRGRVRPTNQDCFFVGRFDRTLEPVLTNVSADVAAQWHHDTGYVAIIADGMGGHAAGDVASQTAVATLLDLVLDTPDWIMRYDDESFVAEVRRRIDDRLQRVDEVLRSMGRRSRALSGMGTTVSLIAVVPPHAIVAHVGDCRVYVRRGGTLTQLTHDHTMAQVLADAGLLDPSELSRAPESNVLTRAAGHGEGHLPVDVERIAIEPGDQLLLCTDGLTKELADADIDRVLATSTSPALAADVLMGLTLERGGRDNITVIVGRVGG